MDSTSKSSPRTSIVIERSSDSGEKAKGTQAPNSTPWIDLKKIASQRTPSSQSNAPAKDGKKAISWARTASPARSPNTPTATAIEKTASESEKSDNAASEGPYISLRQSTDDTPAPTTTRTTSDEEKAVPAFTASTTPARGKQPEKSKKSKFKFKKPKIQIKLPSIPTLKVKSAEKPIASKAKKTREAEFSNWNALEGREGLENQAEAIIEDILRNPIFSLESTRGYKKFGMPRDLSEISQEVAERAQNSKNTYSLKVICEQEVVGLLLKMHSPSIKDNLIPLGHQIWKREMETFDFKNKEGEIDDAKIKEFHSLIVDLTFKTHVVQINTIL